MGLSDRQDDFILCEVSSIRSSARKGVATRIWMFIVVEVSPVANCTDNAAVLYTSGVSENSYCFAKVASA
jgi:hypothetical protein